jgi:RND family efflux transporter MFP subunit
MVQNNNTFLTAPFDGVITKRYVEKGTFIAVGSPAYEMIAIEKLKLIAKLSDEEVSKVSKGEAVKLTVESIPGTTYEGYVGNIIVKADISGRYEAEVCIDNDTAYSIKPGMYGQVFFDTNSKRSLLVIPRSAIEGSILNPEIYLVRGDSVIKKPITASTLDNKYVLVLSGLKEGDIIVASGQINLVNGAKIRIIN